jgi:hypothetical protein
MQGEALAIVAQDLRCHVDLIRNTGGTEIVSVSWSAGGDHIDDRRWPPLRGRGIRSARYAPDHRHHPGVE